jgi:hypothetical protein
MARSNWLVIAGIIGIGVIALVISKRAHATTPPVEPAHPTAPPKTKIPRNPSVPVSAEPFSNYGKCICIHDKLAGPQCNAVGVSCEHAKHLAQINNSCECIGNVATGAGCPIIGKPCGLKVKYPNSYGGAQTSPLSPTPYIASQSPYTEGVA